MPADVTVASLLSRYGAPSFSLRSRNNPHPSKKKIRCSIYKEVARSRCLLILNVYKLNVCLSVCLFIRPVVSRGHKERNILAHDDVMRLIFRDQVNACFYTAVSSYRRLTSFFFCCCCFFFFKTCTFTQSRGRRQTGI